MNINRLKLMDATWLLTTICIIIAFFPFSFHLHLITIVLSLAFLLVIFQVIQNKDIKRILNPYTILMSLWFLVGFISLFWVVNKSAWLTSVGVLYIATLFAYILTYFSQSDHFYSRLNLMFGTIILIHQLLAWVQWFTQQGRVWFSLPITYQFQNPMWFFPNINDFALFQLFVILFILNYQPKGKSLGQNKNLLSICKLILLPQAFILLYLSTSRGVLLSAMLAIVVYLGLHLNRPFWRKKWWTGLWLGAAVVSIPFLYYVYKDAGMRIRFNLLRNGWQYLHMTNFLGVGAGNIPTYLAQYPFYFAGYFTVMHNWWMGVFVTFGLPFFILYMVYNIFVWVKSYFLSVSQGSHRAKLVFTWLTAFLFAGFIPNSLYHFVWFWLIHHHVFITFETENRSIKKLSRLD